MKDRALSTIGLWVVVGLVIWVGGFFSVAEQASFGLLALMLRVALLAEASDEAGGWGAALLILAAAPWSRATGIWLLSRLDGARAYGAVASVGRPTAATARIALGLAAVLGLIAALIGGLPAGGLLLGFALGAVQPMIMSMLHQITPEHRHGEALGLRLMAITASSVVMPIVFGAAGAVVGSLGVFWSVGAIMGVSTRLPLGLRHHRAGH